MSRHRKTRTPRHRPGKELQADEGRELAADLVQVIKQTAARLVKSPELIPVDSIFAIEGQIASDITRFCIYQLKRELYSSSSGCGVFESAWDHIRIRLELLSVNAEREATYSGGAVAAEAAAASELARNLKKYFDETPMAELLALSGEIRKEIRELASAYLQYMRSPTGRGDRHQFSPDGAIIELPVRYRHR